jgi:hypothetical protein
LARYVIYHRQLWSILRRSCRAVCSKISMWMLALLIHILTETINSIVPDPEPPGHFKFWV